MIKSRRGAFARPIAHVLYTGPAVPTPYDQKWQLFTNLTKEQIAWFRAQPEWEQKLKDLGVKHV